MQRRRADVSRWRLRGGGGGWEGLGGRRRGQQRAKRGQMTQAGGGRPAGWMGSWVDPGGGVCKPRGRTEGRPDVGIGLEHA